MFADFRLDCVFGVGEEDGELGDGDDGAEVGEVEDEVGVRDRENLEAAGRIFSTGRVGFGFRVRDTLVSRGSKPLGLGRGRERGWLRICWVRRTPGVIEGVDKYR